HCTALPSLPTRRSSDLISTRANELARTLVSGPIGGVIGAKYLSEKLGIPNIACSDIGGTSFDIALITQGDLSINPSPDMARLVLDRKSTRLNSSHVKIS